MQVAEPMPTMAVPPEPPRPITPAMSLRILCCSVHKGSASENGWVYGLRALWLHALSVYATLALDQWRNRLQHALTRAAALPHKGLTGLSQVS